MKSWVQYVPLAMFVSIGDWGGTESILQWQLAWKAGSILGFIVLTAQYQFELEVNRVFLAANVYLVLGGIFAWAGMGEWLAFYGDVLRGVALFLMLVAVGIISTLYTTRGFINVAPDKSTKVTSYSWYLCCIALLATVISWFGRGQPAYEGIIPFSIVLIGNAVLATRARRQARV